VAPLLILVRHPAVAVRWQSRCYGSSDTGISRHGRASIRSLLQELYSMSPSVVVYSGMRRTRCIAEPLARMLGVKPLIDPGWRERHFGSWEGKLWDTIYRETGNAMEGMINHPSTFRPGGGDTTDELIERVKDSLCALPKFERVLVVTHGGPIAVVRMLLEGGTVGSISEKIIPTGSFFSISRSEST
jgi:alpha-ribazole phosphatase